MTWFIISISVGNYGREHQIAQHVSSNIPAVHDECLTQPPQLELVGHSIVSGLFSCFKVIMLNSKLVR